MDIDKLINSSGNLYTTRFPEYETSLSYRLLSLKEYKVFRSLRDGGLVPEFSLNEMVFERCYIGNAQAISSEFPAGATVSIGSLIMYLSGDCDSETLVEDIISLRTLHPRDTVFEYMRSAIMTAFSSYRIEDLDNLDRTDFLKYFTIAENVLSKQNPDYEQLSIKDINSGEKKQNQTANINFEKENRAITRSVGYWGTEEAEKQYRDENRKLTAEQLKSIQNRSR